MANLEDEPGGGRAEDTGGMSVSALEALTRGEVDVQIRTAKTYPRSASLFVRRALEMATMDEDTAASCFYALPHRVGKPIEGPSVRLAEIAASTWGHMRFGARIIEETDRFVVAMGMAWDLEANNMVSFEVRRPIIDRAGRKFSTDMVAITSNAACSIALRNAVFRVIPRAYIDRICEACKQVARGDIKTLETRRSNAIEAFVKLGVPHDRIFDALGVAGLEDVGLDHLPLLKGMWTAVKDGETTLDVLFPPKTPPAPEDAKGVAGLKGRAQRETKPPAPEPPKEPKAETVAAPPPVPPEPEARMFSEDPPGADPTPQWDDDDGDEDFPS